MCTVFVAVAVCTAMGRSVFAMAGPTWRLLVAAGLLFVLLAVAIARMGTRRHLD